MTDVILPIPPSNVPVFDPRSGRVTYEWQNFYNALEAYINAQPIIPPDDAAYIVATSDPGLPDAVNLGALNSGVLTMTQSGGTATLATTAQAALTGVSDTNVTLTIGGTPTTALLRAVSLTVGWSGVLAVGRGGTGVSNATQTYTPTLTGVLNVTTATPSVCQYARIGSVVWVSGRVTVTPTATGTVRVGISLPVPTNLAADTQCAGAAGIVNKTEAGSIYGDTTNDRAQLDFVASFTSAEAVFVMFQYLVV